MTTSKFLTAASQKYQNGDERMFKKVKNKSPPTKKQKNPKTKQKIKPHLTTITTSPSILYISIVAGTA